MARTKQLIIRPTFGNAIDTLISSGATTTRLSNDAASGAGNTAGAVWRTLLRFPLDEIPASATIASAKVKLYCYQVGSTTAYNISFHRSLVQWYAGPGNADTYSTWNHRDALATTAWTGGAGGASGTEWAASATATTSVQHVQRYYRWDVTADVQDFIDGTANNYGWWILSADEATTTSLKRFYTANHYNPGFIPVLYVTYSETGETDDWYDTDWGFRKPIVIDSSQVDADLTDYPMLVDLSGDADVPTDSAVANYGDVFFTAADGITRLPHEMAGPPFEFVTVDGTWSFFGDPVAVRHVGSADKTYIGWVSTVGDIVIAAYNHGTSSWEGPTTLKAALEADDHAMPSILVRDSDSKIMVFYCAHGGAEMYLRISSNAEDITAFAAEQTLDVQIGGSTYEYPVPIQLTAEANDPIYLFYTNGGANRALRYSVSTDGGTTWAAETSLYGGTNYRYFHAIPNGTARIDFVVSNNTPNVATTSLYHFYYTGGNFYQSDGTQIVASQPYATGNLTLVHNGSTDDNSWNLDIAAEGGGTPVIGYVTYPGAGSNDQRYNYARWSGAAWVSNEIVAAGGRVQTDDFVYPGGLSIDPDTPSTVYLSRAHNGVHNIFRYTTADNGATWTQAQQITNSAALPHIRPRVVRGGDSELPVVWLYGDYQTYTNYNTAVVCNLDTSPAKFWVRVPTIASAADTTIYVYYGNAAAAAQHVNDLVWEEVFEFVMHGWKRYLYSLNMSMPPIAFEDTDISVMTAGTGVVYEDLEWPSATNRPLTVGVINQRGWTGISAEAISNRTTGGTAKDGLLDSGVGGGAAGVIMRVRDSDDVAEFYAYTTSGLVGGALSGITIAKAADKHVVMRYDNANGIEGIVNKTVSTATASGSGVLGAVNSNSIQVGIYSTDRYTGTLEEVRIASVRLSDAWVNFTYDSIFGSVLTPGTEEAAPDPEPEPSSYVPRPSGSLSDGIMII